MQASHRSPPIVNRSGSNLDPIPADSVQARECPASPASRRRLHVRPPPILIVLGALLVALLITGCSGAPGDKTPASSAAVSVSPARTPRPGGSQPSASQVPLGAPSSALQITEFVLDQTPELGGQATLNITVQMLHSLPAPNTTLTVGLPEGVDLVQGDLVWQDDLAGNETRVSSLVLGFPQEGTFTIAAEVLSVASNGQRWGDGAIFYVKIARSGSAVSGNPFTTPTADPEMPGLRLVGGSSTISTFTPGP